MAGKGKKGGRKGAANNNHQKPQRNISNKWCIYCRKDNHNTVDCQNKPHDNHLRKERHRNSSHDDGNDEPRFRYCTECKELGHDNKNCKVLLKKLRDIGVEAREIEQDGIFVPIPFKNKVLKDYTNPFAPEKVQKTNPFADLFCTHSTSCRGLCGNKHYMAKSKVLKRQLEEVLGNMQLWLEALTPPEDDAMDWEDAPMIEIRQTRELGPYVRPERAWELNPEPLRLPPGLGIKRFLKVTEPPQFPGWPPLPPLPAPDNNRGGAAAGGAAGAAGAGAAGGAGPGAAAAA